MEFRGWIQDVGCDLVSRQIALPPGLLLRLLFPRLSVFSFYRQQATRWIATRAGLLLTASIAGSIDAYQIRAYES
jgi:hypothetical protein